MHIPDGYLSASTCAFTYVSALPFLAVGVKQAGRLPRERLAPLVGLASAFSFVVMMFNLPLPGGTTGHAVGMGIAAAVLGPWASMLAIAVALAIQALVFGDGGVTTLGANVLNMAVVGSLVAYAVYVGLAGRSELRSTRRVVAAAVAGYVALNAAALLTAFEFGIQPTFFHDAAGAPLYAPYPLAVAVPAMMYGHLTFAGLGEMVVTGGLFAWLQYANPALLAPFADLPAGVSPWRATRRLWAGLAALAAVTPLGLLATGVAWGEWGAADFADPAGRAAIELASGNAALPEAVPQGLARLAEVWSAPFPDYAPAFLANEAAGYVLSAALGAGLIALAFAMAARLAPRAAR